MMSPVALTSELREQICGKQATSSAAYDEYGDLDWCFAVVLRAHLVAWMFYGDDLFFEPNSYLRNGKIRVEVAAQGKLSACCFTWTWPCETERKLG